MGGCAEWGLVGCGVWGVARVVVVWWVVVVGRGVEACGCVGLGCGRMAVAGVAGWLCVVRW